MAAMVYKRLSDARRFMNKKKDRLQSAMHTFKPMRARDDHDRAEARRVLHRKVQGPVTGMAQAALLLGCKLEIDRSLWFPPTEHSHH